MVKCHSWDIKPEISKFHASPPSRPCLITFRLAADGKLPRNSEINHLCTPAVSVQLLKIEFEAHFHSPSFPPIWATSFDGKSNCKRNVGSPSAHRAWILSPLIDHPLYCELLWGELSRVLGWTLLNIAFFQNGIKYSSEPELANSRAEGGDQEYQSIHEGAAGGLQHLVRHLVRHLGHRIQRSFKPSSN